MGHGYTDPGTDMRFPINLWEEGSKAWVGAIMETTSANKTY
jgi:hypothetical protein